MKKPRKEIWTLNPNCPTGRKVVEEVKKRVLSDRKVQAFLGTEGMRRATAPVNFVPTCGKKGKK